MHQICQAYISRRTGLAIARELNGIEQLQFICVVVVVVVYCC